MSFRSIILRMGIFVVLCSISTVFVILKVDQFSTPEAIYSSTQVERMISRGTRIVSEIALAMAADSEDYFQLEFESNANIPPIQAVRSQDVPDGWRTAYYWVYVGELPPGTWHMTSGYMNATFDDENIQFSIIPSQVDIDWWTVEWIVYMILAYVLIAFVCILIRVRVPFLEGILQANEKPKRRG